jgi:Flp pilus assembly protein CpaB
MKDLILGAILIAILLVIVVIGDLQISLLQETQALAQANSLAIDEATLVVANHHLAQANAWEALQSFSLEQHAEFHRYFFDRMELLPNADTEL